MRKQKNWWVWVGLGLLVLFIAFKVTSRENFTKAPIGNRGNEENDKILKKVKEVMTSLGYKDETMLRQLGPMLVGPGSINIQRFYDNQTEKISRDEFVKLLFEGDRSGRQITKFSDLPTEGEKQLFNTLYEYLYNYPPIPIDQPVTLVHLV